MSKPFFIHYSFLCSFTQNGSFNCDSFSFSRSSLPFITNLSRNIVRQLRFLTTRKNLARFQQKLPHKKEFCFMTGKLWKFVFPAYLENENNTHIVSVSRRHLARIHFMAEKKFFLQTFAIYRLFFGCCLLPQKFMILSVERVPIWFFCSAWSIFLTITVG